MDANETPDWETFEQKLKGLRAQYGDLSSPLLFRGQGSSEWTLTTTLERNGPRAMRFGDFYRLISTRVCPAIETFTGVSWDVPEYDNEVEESYHDPELFAFPPRFPPLALYRYMVYLRHHGFPSPLLDWSRSPYVAAFFAFRDLPPEGGKRSIYAFSEMPEGYKGGAVGETQIRSIGPYVRSDPGIFVSNPITRSAPVSTTVGVFIRTRMYSSTVAPSKISCGNSIFPQQSESRYCAC